MIEVNLLPGTPKRARRLRRLTAAGGLRARGAGPDLWILVPALAWVLGGGMVGWLLLGDRSRGRELQEGLAAAAQDSTRYAVIARQDSLLTAQRDTIAQKLEIIQDIDAGRYVWAHIMDEVARNLPPYTWVVGISDVAGDVPPTTPEFRIDGRAGNTFDLTQFIRDLEASPFIRDVTLETTQQITENDRPVYSFLLTARYETPAPDAIQTVPLFTREGED